MITTEQLSASGLIGESSTGIDVTTGVDIVELPRLMKLAQRPRGLATVLTERELEYCCSRPQPPAHLAARFAAKEAVLKAFGTGLAQGIRWTDVEILNERGGRPTVVLHGAAKALAEARGLCRLDVSLSHTGQIALAQAVALWTSAPAREVALHAQIADAA
jgi:holo-[acyl-carrier protein] synthase